MHLHAIPPGTNRGILARELVASTTALEVARYSMASGEAVCRLQIGVPSESLAARFKHA